MNPDRLVGDWRGMTQRQRWACVLFLAAALVATMLAVGCAGNKPPNLDPCDAAKAIAAVVCATQPADACTQAKERVDAACGVPPPSCPEACPAGQHCEAGKCVADQPPPPPPPADCRTTGCPAGQQCVKLGETEPAVYVCGAIPPPPPPPPPATGCDLDKLYDATTPMDGLGESKKPPLPTKLAVDINDAIAQVSGCPIGSDCRVGPYAIFVPKVAESLRARGWCVGIKIHPDALAISDPADLSLNYAIHAHNAGGDKARWVPGAYLDAWRLKNPPPPPPTCPPCPAGSTCTDPAKGCVADQPPPTGDAEACGAPLPKRVSDGQMFKFNSHPHVPQGVIDATWIIVGVPDYCRAIGYTDGRNNCPVRTGEGAQKMACERYSAEGTFIAKGNDGLPCQLYELNPSQFYSRGGHCQICDKTAKFCSTSY